MTVISINSALATDDTLVDPENPPDPPLSPFARVSEETGKLVYEQGRSEEDVFPGDDVQYTNLVPLKSVMANAKFESIFAFVLFYALSCTIP